MNKPLTVDQLVITTIELKIAEIELNGREPVQHRTIRVTYYHPPSNGRIGIILVPSVEPKLVESHFTLMRMTADCPERLAIPFQHFHSLDDALSALNEFWVRPHLVEALTKWGDLNLASARIKYELGDVCSHAATKNKACRLMVESDMDGAGRLDG